MKPFPVRHFMVKDGIEIKEIQGDKGNIVVVFAIEKATDVVRWEEMGE